MSKQLSSVEWLINEIDMQFPHIDIKWKEQMISQAKAMHQEEHKKAYIEGAKSIMHGVISRPEHLLEKAEIYYNLTFGKSENSEK